MSLEGLQVKICTDEDIFEEEDDEVNILNETSRVEDEIVEMTK
jgi:hypothetical protein